MKEANYQSAEIREAETAAGLSPEQEAAARRFQKLGMAGAIYALFYTFCLYRNTSGITYPFFVAGTFLFYFYCMKKSEVSCKKGTAFYLTAVMLLGISNVLTGDGKILFLNRTGIVLLCAGFLLHQFYQDGSWGLAHYLGNLFRVFAGTICRCFTPYLDFWQYRKLHGWKRSEKSRAVLAGLGLAAPLLLVILFLLSSADRMFAYLFTDLLGSFIKSAVLPFTLRYGLTGILWKLFLGLAAGYGLMVFLGQRNLPETEKEGEKGETVTAITIAAVLALVYIVFCGVQIVGLFLQKVTLPEGYSYAGYAREGFFQLLFVCILNLILVLVCLKVFPRHPVLEGLLALISFCTYVMIASSAFRMLLYIRSYYLSFLRILVLWTLTVLAVLMGGVLIWIFLETFPLFRYSMITVTLLYLALSFSGPDDLIARCNTGAGRILTADFFQPEGEPDIGYLYRLSSDAAPALYRADLRDYGGMSEEYWRRQAEYAEEMSLRTFNWSRYRAGKLARGT